MVKKSSFLDKLKNRLRPASGIVVEGPDLSSRSSSAPAGSPSSRLGAGESAIGGGSSRARRPASGGGASTPSAQSAPSPTTPPPEVPPPEPARLQAVAMPMADNVSSRKLKPKEEAVVAINEGFKELSSLLRGMQTRIDGQGDQIGAAADSLGHLPALGQAQVDLMRQMLERMERQGAAADQLNEKLGDMPEAMANLKESLEKAQATDVRTAKTLDEFKTNMESIQGAMSQIVEHSGQQASAASRVVHDSKSSAEKQTQAVQGMVRSFEGSHKETLSKFEESTDASVKSLKKAQDQQADRLRTIAEGNEKATKKITTLLIIAVVALVVMVVVLAVK